MTREERKKRDARIIAMYVDEGLSLSQIAQRISTPENTVSGRSVGLILARHGVMRRARGGANNTRARAASRA